MKTKRQTSFSEELGRKRSKKRKKPPTRRKNSDARDREYLTPDEVEKLMTAARGVGRHGHRDATMILLMYRHALRVSEACSLQWTAFDLKQGTFFVKRLKKGLDSVHPLRGPELRALRQLKREYPNSRYVFMSELGAPFTDRNMRLILARAGKLAKLQISVHPHMLRHSTGYKLANDGHDTRSIQQYMGHKNIQHTVRYTQLNARRFDGFWRD